MVGLKIRFPVQQKSKDRFLEVICSLLGLIRTEFGCVECTMYEEVEDRNSVVLNQQWCDIVSLRRHIQGDTYRKILIAMDLLRCAPEIYLSPALGDQRLLKPEDLHVALDEIMGDSRV